MESPNSSPLSYFHHFVQDNSMYISSNEQHISESLFSATASTSSDTSDGSTEVCVHISQRKRQRKSSSSETNETNSVPSRKKSKKYVHLPDDLAEARRLRVNQLEKERQRQINEVFQELKDLKLPELIKPGAKMKKNSKSYIVRNTRANLILLHNEKQRLLQKLQQKMQRKELVGQATEDKHYNYGTPSSNNNFSANMDPFGRKHIQTNVGTGRYPMRNVGSSQMYNIETATSNTHYVMPVTVGNITSTNANVITMVKSDYVFPGTAGHIAPVKTKNIKPSNSENIVHDSFGRTDMPYVQSNYFLSSNVDNVQPVVTYNNTSVRSTNIMPSCCSENLVPDTLGHRLPVSAVNIQPTDGANIAPFHNSEHSNTGYYNSFFCSGYSDQRNFYQNGHSQ